MNKPCCVSCFRALISAFILLASANAFAFKVSDIRVQGLQRISAGSVFNAIPVNVGDDVGPMQVREIIRDLFKTGWFDDVKVGRDGTVLVIIVKERPTIDAIKIKGNKAIKTKALKEGLKKSGLAAGDIFKKVTLERIRTDLEHQYVQQGRYGAKIKTKVVKLPRNRVKIEINITEGAVSSIRHIDIVGNTVYDDKTLLDQLQLKLPSLFSFYTKNDKYSREKLKGDLERLESYYMDRGYLNFTVNSTQVSISPDKRDVYITINVTEGKKFTVSKVEVAGQLHDVSEKAIRSLILVRRGQVFSRKLMSDSENRIEKALGNAGYTFANATGQPEQNESGNTVTVKFFVDAGKRAYVRRINFRGNTMTEDHVLRREMRQMEGGWASTAFIQASKVRLQRLGFFKSVDVETPEVPGTDDQIDVNYTVKEAPSGSISATVGYAQDTGLLLGANYQQTNVFGTGNSVNIGLNHSAYQTSYQFSYFNPYYTINGVSRGYSVYYQTNNYNALNVASFSTDSFGGSVSFGYPISEISRIGLSVGFENTKVKQGIFPAQEISQFLQNEGNVFNLATLTATYQMSALNRGLLPTAGRSQQVSLEFTVPGSQLEYYRLQYQGQIFFPLFKGLRLRLKTNLGYGGVYGHTHTYPFYKNFFAGGLGSVRGYRDNSLGPRATPAPQSNVTQLYPIGGNVLIDGSAEVLFPMPFVSDQSQIRSAFFVDAGNVFNTNCLSISIVCHGLKNGELRYSAGVSITWITSLAPLSFSLGFPLNKRPGDQTQVFQFQLGSVF